MELKKVLEPWNWFKKEDEAKHVPIHVRHSSGENPLIRLHDDMNQVFDDFFRGFPSSVFSRNLKSPWEEMIRPQVDIAENAKNYTITIEIPGVEEKDIDLTLSERTLTIRGEKRSEKEEQDKQYHRVERSFGSFQRVLSLPENANEQEVAAEFKNGVLTITVGKASQVQPTGRKIVING